jgi:hypothetical protein
MTVAGAWNMENLFRPGGDFGPHDDEAYQAKIRGLADTISGAAVDVLAVEEVGDPAALDDVAALLDGDWHAVTSAVFEPAHPIRVGFLSRMPLEIIADVAAFPQMLRPIQADDNGGTIKQMGRGALAVRTREDSGRDLVIVACHLKSKLLSFPGPGGKSRFTPHDEGERARVADYALSRRAAEAVTVRALADDLHRWRRPPRQRRRRAAVEPRPPPARGRTVLADLPRPPRAHRPPPGQPRTPRPHHGSTHRPPRDAALDHR